jgi:hypothetical protein
MKKTFKISGWAYRDDIYPCWGIYFLRVHKQTITKNSLIRFIKTSLSLLSIINTFVQDIVSNWASRIELSIRYNNDTASMGHLIRENQAISKIFIV